LRRNARKASLLEVNRALLFTVDSSRRVPRVPSKRMGVVVSALPDGSLQTDQTTTRDEFQSDWDNLSRVLSEHRKRSGVAWKEFETKTVKWSSLHNLHPKSRPRRADSYGKSKIHASKTFDTFDNIRTVPLIPLVVAPRIVVSRPTSPHSTCSSSPNGSRFDMQFLCPHYPSSSDDEEDYEKDDEY